MNSLKIRIALIIIVAFTLIIPGCIKDDTNQVPSYDFQSARDNAWAENIFSDIFQWVDDAAKDMDDSLYNAKTKSASQLMAGGCATVSLTPFDTINWPKTLTIDFGPVNCLCADGKYRRGKIISVLTGRYRDSATVITDSLAGYYVNDFLVQGKKVITNIGHNTSGNLTFNVAVIDASITTFVGTIYWNSTRTREWISGESTPWPNIWDDVYHLSGGSWGVNVYGDTFNVTIINPLEIEIGCKWITAGSLEIDPIGNTSGIVNYGNGGCDDQASITINGNTYTFTMN